MPILSMWTTAVLTDKSVDKHVATDHHCLSQTDSTARTTHVDDVITYYDWYLLLIVQSVLQSKNILMTRCQWLSTLISDMMIMTTNIITPELIDVRCWYRDKEHHEIKSSSLRHTTHVEHPHIIIKQFIISTQFCHFYTYKHWTQTKQLSHYSDANNNG